MFYFLSLKLVWVMFHTSYCSVYSCREFIRWTIFTFWRRWISFVFSCICCLGYYHSTVDIPIMRAVTDVTTIIDCCRIIIVGVTNISILYWIRKYQCLFPNYFWILHLQAEHLAFSIHTLPRYLLDTSNLILHVKNTLSNSEWMSHHHHHHHQHNQQYH